MPCHRDYSTSGQWDLLNAPEKELKHGECRMCRTETTNYDCHFGVQKVSKQVITYHNITYYNIPTYRDIRTCCVPLHQHCQILAVFYGTVAQPWLPSFGLEPCLYKFLKNLNISSTKKIKLSNQTGQTEELMNGQVESYQLKNTSVPALLTSIGKPFRMLRTNPSKKF